MKEESASILLVEDHQDIAEMLYAYLERRGYVLDYAADGNIGLHLAVTNEYDAIILDLMLPGMNGLELCDKLRNHARKDTPVLMLTARDTLDDKVKGLDTGADDYLVKPFEVQELEARLRAMIRRHRGVLGPEAIAVGDLVLDTGTLVVRRAGQDLSLSPIALKLLTALMRNSPRVMTRGELERQIWGDLLPDSDTLRSHLYNLRKVIDRPFERQLLHTIQGAGYRIADQDES
ncbi:MAG: DNA-binding response OmpR family regulator [Gammaproteobacteria bacterium]|jgi:DNA-binding response OmpR family regulator